MVNCFCPFNHLKNSLTKSPSSIHTKIIQVVKLDGKIMEFRSQILVSDLLVSFPGLNVCFSRKPSSKNLPLSYELKLGNTYYLQDSSVQETEQVKNGGVKRIKIIITKKQLQELLSKEVLVESNLTVSPKSKLDSIPEGIEL